MPATDTQGNRVRGIRQQLPANVLIGRGAGAGGPAQQLSLSAVAQAIIQQGAIPLPGGGLITAVDSNFTVTSGTLSLHTTADGNLLANIAGSTAEPIANTLTAILDHILGNTEGDILQRGSSAWQVLAPGTNGQVLTSGGAGALNSWTSSGGGTSITDAGVWNSLSGYLVGNCARYNGGAYICYVAIAAPTGSAAAWSGSDNVGMTRSTTNTTNDTATTQAVANSYCESTSPGQTAGKWYFEGLTSNLLDNGFTLGIAEAGLAQNYGGNALGQIGGSAGFVGHASGSFAGLTNNKHAGVAVDLTNALFWITADVTAGSINWNGSTSNNPSTGTGGLSLGTLPGGLLYPSVYGGSAGSANQHCVLSTTVAQFAISAVPTGFAPWSTSAVPSTPPDQDINHWLSQGSEIPLQALYAHAVLGGL